MSDEKLKKFLRTVPKIFNARQNPVINALLQGFAGSDEEISVQIQNTKAQLFVKRAVGQGLDILGNALGVRRPVSLGLVDDDYRKLIPNLSLKAKTIRKAFYDTAEIFWGPLFIHANTTTLNFAPFNISPGDVIEVAVNNGDHQRIKALTDDIAIPGSATAEEIVAILNRIEGCVASVINDAITGEDFVNLRTVAPGPSGSLEIFDSTMIGSSRLNFEIKKHELIQQAQRVALYEIRPNEVLIEIPAIVPALRRTLKGSHHLHADSTLESPVPPANGIWQGSFLFDPDGSSQSFTVTSQRAIIQEPLLEGEVYTKVTVDDASGFENKTGVIIFGWGTESQEQPVRFRGVPNSQTILLDPSYVFKNTQNIGTVVNVLADQLPFEPNRDGSDLAIYLTSPSDAREVVQEILKSLAAAGVIVNFVILAPDYKYLIDNPYLSTDDAG